MKKLEIELDDKTYDAAARFAEERNASIEEVIVRMLEGITPAAQGMRGIVGLFAAEPDLMDAVCEDAMRARADHELRR
jgi:hypothetical protein